MSMLNGATVGGEKDPSWCPSSSTKGNARSYVWAHPAASWGVAAFLSPWKIEPITLKPWLSRCASCVAREGRLPEPPYSDLHAAHHTAHDSRSKSFAPVEG